MNKSVKRVLAILLATLLIGGTMPRAFLAATISIPGYMVLNEGFSIIEPYTTHGWEYFYENSYWGAVAGHNGTNYVAWRLIINGAEKSITGHARDWDDNAQALGYAVDNRPAVGSVAHWNANEKEVGGTYGQVAFVEFVGEDFIIVTMDTIAAQTFYWVKIENSSPAYPGRFLHVADDPSSKSGDDGVTNWDFIEPVTHLNAPPIGYAPIRTPQELYQINNNLAGNYILMNNIDLSSFGVWPPIGEKFLDQFTGTFDGNGYVVKGLDFNESIDQRNAYGLFSKVSGTIKNLGIVDSYITVGFVDDDRGYTVGSIAGILAGRIDNCFNTGDIYASGLGGAVGGIAGTATEVYVNSYITNCYNTGKIRGSGTAGGIVAAINGQVRGAAVYNSLINYCYNKGEITGAITGGICGESLLYSYIYYCYNEGTVCSNLLMQEGGWAGGIVGSLSDHLAYCYNQGNVFASGSNVAFAGGIAGQIVGNRSSATSSYSSGTIGATGGTASYEGGIVGEMGGKWLTECAYLENSAREAFTCLACNLLSLVGLPKEPSNHELYQAVALTDNEMRQIDIWRQVYGGDPFNLFLKMPYDGYPKLRPQSEVMAESYQVGLKASPYVSTPLIGSGHYRPWEYAVISAGPASGRMVFSKWEIEGDIMVGNLNSPTTALVAPKDTYINATAIYKDIAESLRIRINELSSVVQGNYTDESWSVFYVARNNANSIAYSTSTVPTQAQVDVALAVLNAAYEGLTEKNVPPAQYALTVNGGSGGGNYEAGAIVSIIANAAPTGKRFKEWNISPVVTFTGGTSKTSATAKFTMPNGAVTATAMYEDIPTPTTTMPTTTQPTTTTTRPITTQPTTTTTATTTTNPVTVTTTAPSIEPTTNPPSSTMPSTKNIFNTNYKATFINWLLFFLGFGWLWMWF